MSRNNFQRPVERKRSPQTSRIPVLHVRAHRRAREEQERSSSAQQTAMNDQSLTSQSVEPTNQDAPSASPKKSNSSLNPNAKEFVFTPQFEQQPFTGLRPSAQDFVPQQPIMMYPMAVPQPVMMMPMPMQIQTSISHIQIPRTVFHVHHYHHDHVVFAEDVEEAQRMMNTPDSASISSTSDTSPAPKLATIEEESELDWQEGDTRDVFFPHENDFDEDDSKEAEGEEGDTDRPMDFCRDDGTGKLLDGGVRRYCLDELISYRSLSICQSKPSDETLLMKSFLSCVSVTDRSSMDDAFDLMSKPLPLLPKRIVGKTTLNKNRNNLRPRFEKPSYMVHNRRNPPPRKPVRLSELSQRRRALSAIPQTELDGLMKKCRSILNKITPENYEKLMTRLSELVESKVNCYEHLEVVLSEIVNVGVTQTAFAERYVQILKDMAKKTEDMVRSWDWFAQCDEQIDSNKIVKVIVRDCCRKNHELYWHTCNSSRQSDFLHSFVTTELDGDLRRYPRELSNLVIEYCIDDDSMLKVKRKFVGLEVLMGQMCKQKMLPEKLIFRDVINPLLRVFDQGRKNDKESWRGSVSTEELEAVCKLLEVVGFELDAKAPKWMDTYFNEIESVSSSLESRMKFMVMDLKDLRATNWGRPRVQENVKKVSLRPRRRVHFEDVSQGFRGNVSSHGAYGDRRGAGRNSYSSRSRYVRKTN